MADKENYFIPIEGKLIEVEKNVYVAYYRIRTMGLYRITPSTAKVSMANRDCRMW